MWSKLTKIQINKRVFDALAENVTIERLQPLVEEIEGSVKSGALPA